MSATKRTLISLLLLTVLAGGCRSSAKSIKLGRLTIISEPADGADIYINNRRQTLKTNAFFNLKPGVYAIKLVKADGDANEPAVGEASVAVKAGRAARAVISLNKMKIVPAATAGPPRPETQGQKGVLDYYAALAAKDWEKAFAHLSRRAKWERGGFWRFSKTAKETASVKVLAIELESSDPTKSVEVNLVTLEVAKAPTKTEPTPETERVNVIVTTADELGGAGLLKIESIVETSSPTRGHDTNSATTEN